MTRLLHILTVSLVAFAVSASTADAGWRTDRATAIAQTVWHHPCVDRMQITWGPLENDDEIGEALYGCVVRLSDTQPLTWEEFCTTVLHEAGHLAGMDHTHSGIMQAAGHVVVTRVRNARTGKVATFVDGADPRCRDRGRPYLAAHGLGTVR